MSLKANQDSAVEGMISGPQIFKTGFVFVRSTLGHGDQALFLKWVNVVRLGCGTMAILAKETSEIERKMWTFDEPPCNQPDTTLPQNGCGTPTGL